eukprot:scaffold234877_cov19-Tisochrysis_lutea.AAC.1
MYCRNYRMIAVSGVMSSTHANVLKDLMTDWCVQEKGPGTQSGLHPGRRTLHPLFISRQLKHAAKSSNRSKHLDYMLLPL